MGRRPCCSKVGLKRGKWTALEDKILTSYIKVHGEGNWRNLLKRAGLKRCGKSCRLRWVNYLKPDIKRGNITPDEEELILRLHRHLGNRWSLIAGRLPGRTDNEVKNYWNTNLAKKANPPSRQSNQNGPSTATDVLKPLPTKATRWPQVTRPQAVRLSTKFALINSNAPQPLSKSFDLHRNAVNVIYNQDSEFPISQHDDRVTTTSDDLQGIFKFENNVDDPFPVSNFLSIENFLMEEDCMIGNVRSGGEYEINKNHKDMESLEMFLNAEECFDSTYVQIRIELIIWPDNKKKKMV